MRTTTVVIGAGHGGLAMSRCLSDRAIDAFAARVKATYSEKFFLVLNHEPENDVIARAGSGWEAKDFAAIVGGVLIKSLTGEPGKEPLPGGGGTDAIVFSFRWRP